MTDNLQPNVLTVDADGNIGAEFTGKVNAQGLVLPAGTGSKGDVNEIEWTRSSDGAIVADIYATNALSGESQLFLEAQKLDAGTEVAQLQLRSKAGAGNSQITMGFAPGTAGGQLMDDAGRSIFLQLLSAQQLQIDGGAANMPFAGTSGPVTVVVNHGLGRVPARVTAIYDYAGNTGLFITAQARDANTITFRGLATAAVAGNVAFDWNAIG